MRQQLGNNLSGCRQPAAVVIAQSAIGQLCRQGVHHHIARAGIEGRHILQLATGGQQRDIADAADVLKGHILGFTAVEQEFGIGYQRRALAPCRHVPDAEIADHRAAEFLCQVRWIADLQGAPETLPQIRGLLGNVVDRLAVAADEVNLGCSGLVQQIPNSLGIALSQVGSQQAQLPAAPHVTAADGEDPLAGELVEGLEVKAQLLHLRVPSKAGNPGENRVHAVGRGAAHQPHHQPGGLLPKRAKWMFHIGSSFLVRGNALSLVYPVSRRLSRKHGFHRTKRRRKTGVSQGGNENGFIRR